ncbi:hypothetical protein V6N11_037779 [Hibiscus sabdariffa]|uniref:Uncharacterized protein n=1 Tax=Hibiscus sabdariffa TaxID=183260 RepID=A0ABR2PEZ8_9ROSI
MNLGTNASIVPNKNFKETIKVGVRFCVAKESNGESSTSFTTPYVPHLSQKEPVTDSLAVSFSLHNIFRKVDLSSGKVVPFTGVMDNANMKCNEGLVKGKSPIIASVSVMDNANKECIESWVKDKAPSCNTRFPVW